MSQEAHFRTEAARLTLVAATTAPLSNIIIATPFSSPDELRPIDIISGAVLRSVYFMYLVN
jgi:hypothetical protein